METIESALEYLKDFDSYSPYQEVITKVSDYIEQMQADYEARLRADMVAMLTEIQLEIEELKVKKHFQYKHGQEHGLNDALELIQQKINSLKENT